MAFGPGNLRGLLRDVARGREVGGARLAACLRRATSRSGLLRFQGARCTGPLDLRHVRLEAPLEFVDCVFDAEIRLDAAEVESLDLTGSEVPGLRADGLRVHGDLVLRGA